ncbi:MAG TPA: hypothetical protein VGO51_01695 [Burkholderiaceae bacterium]|nr:hypothetical protein [Burkholderiaceae bacterium]
MSGFAVRLKIMQAMRVSVHASQSMKLLWRNHGGQESAFWDINVSAGFVDLAPQGLQFFRRQPAGPSGTVRSALPAITLLAILLLIGLASGPILLASLLLASPTSTVVVFPIRTGTGDCSCHACHQQ